MEAVGDAANTWVTGTAVEKVDQYVSSVDAIIVERERTIKLLLDLFRYHFGEKENLRILDLGCGDGAITERLRAAHPNHMFHLLDGSAEMIEKAKARLRGNRAGLVCQSFEKYLDLPAQVKAYDFVFSSLAIHHLDSLAKSRLYAKLFRELAPGGLFVNIDVVLPNSERSERYQFNMWLDWMNERLAQTGGKVGKHDHLPAAYKSKPENQPSGLFEQLQALRQVGFRDVDCFYKYGIFAMFGGTK